MKIIRFALLLTFFMGSSAFAEQWIFVSESRNSTGPQRLHIDIDSVRHDRVNITYKIKYETNWFNSGRQITTERYVIADCAESRRFEGASSSELGERNFKSVFPGTPSALELAVACTRLGLPVASSKPQTDPRSGDGQPSGDAAKTSQERLASEFEAERKKRLELEQRLAAAEARERERLQAQPQPTAQLPRPQAALRSERRFALIVGNAAYQISPLDNPVNDATDVDAGLKRAGFQTTLLRNATLAQMREATRRFADQLTTADVALIYFAGHGIESRGRNYMVPVNADLKFEHELLDQAFDANQWLEMLEGIRSANADRVNIVILDACRNNNLIGARSLSRGLGRLDAPSGTFLAYSTGPGKVAADGPRGQRNSPFTKHLLQAMQQPNLPIEEVFKEVRRNVSRETAGAQVPWESTSLTGFFSFRQER